MENKTTNRSHLIGLIHAQKSAAGLSDDNYRILINGITNKTTCKDCSMIQLTEIFAQLNAILKQQGTEPFKYFAHRPTLRDAVEARAQKVLGNDFEKRLTGFLARIKKPNLASCTEHDLRAVMGFLSTMERCGK